MNKYEFGFDEFECDDCGWIGASNSKRYYEDSDADGSRGRWVRYVTCANCHSEKGFDEGF